MTSVPTDLGAFRTGTVIPLTGLTGGAVGIAPDAAHLAGGGYHVGPDDIRSIGRYDTDYSTRQARDRIGGNDASALDIGDNWPNGGRAAWLRYNGLVVAQMRAGDPELGALRALNFSPDGTLCRRYDSLHPEQGIIASTDSVYMHTHHEFWRDTRGTALRARALARLGQLIAAAIRNAPAPTAGEDIDMGASEIVKAWANGNTTASTGEPVEPVKWQIRNGQWQESVSLQLTSQAATLAGLRKSLDAALAAIKALSVATGNDPGPIFAAIKAVGDDAHAASVAVQQQLDAANHRLAMIEAAAEANLSPAERAGLGLAG